MRRYTLGLDVTQRLGDIPLFRGLSAPQLRMISRHLDGIDAEAGEELVSQGTNTYHYILIEDGGAEVFQDGARIATLGPGDFFGELALLSGGAPRSATVVATAPLRAFVLSSNSLHQIREHMPLVAERIDRTAQERRARDAEASRSPG